MSLKLAFAETNLRVEARNYTAVADLENDSPENMEAWERLRAAAIAYARAEASVLAGRRGR